MRFTNAQVAKKTMLEHFTNTKCGTCAARNPGLNANLNLHPQVLRIQIHPSSPYVACFLSMQNTSDNDARTNFYNIYGTTPRLVINGVNIPNATNYADTSLFTSYAGLSPFSISIEQYAIGIDSIQSRITIQRVAIGTPNDSAKLFAGLVEDTVFGNGGNGELQHYNVLRRSLLAPQGMVIPLPAAVGDSLVITKTEKYNSIWNQNRMATVAILQDKLNKQLIQSELSSTAKTSIITSLDNNNCRPLEIAIYPNPANNFIAFQNLNTESITYQLINSKGEVVQSATTRIRIIDTTLLPSGIYLLQVFNEKSITVKKVLIVH